jgi:hypothetical protein
MSSKGATEVSFEAYHPSAARISLRGRHFVDNHDRVLDLRGANVGSASKVSVIRSLPASVERTVAWCRVAAVRCDAG